MGGLSREQILEVASRCCFNVLKIVNQIVLSMDLIDIIKILPGRCIFMEIAGVSITIFQPFTPRFLPPPFRLLPACNVEI